MKTLIFDFDGTIADSFETLLSIFETITKRSEKLTPKEIENLRGQSLSQIIKYLKIKRWQIPKLIIKGKREIAHRINDVHAFNGIEQSLVILEQNGYQMFILSTNSAENIHKFLKNNKLEKYFSGVYGDIGLRSKSSALKKIIKKENLSIDKCSYIGDEVRDIDAAKKTGVKSIAVAWGFNYPKALKSANPDILVSTPAELSKYLTS